MAFQKVRVAPGQFDDEGQNVVLAACGHRHRTPEAADHCESVDIGGRAYLVVDCDTGRAPDGWPQRVHPWGVE